MTLSDVCLSFMLAPICIFVGVGIVALLVLVIGAFIELADDYLSGGDKW